jgi:hypothetical protein
MPVFTVVLALGIPVLFWYASKAILESTDGTLQEAITDPSAPGYETLVASTPSHLLLGVDDDEQLAMVAVMALASSDQGGTVLLIPVEAMVDDTMRLIDVHAAGGSAATRRAVASMISAEVDALSVLDRTSWTQFTAVAAPLAVTLTDDLVAPGADGVESVVHPAGPIELTAAEVGEVVSWLNPGEDPFNRIVRQRIFWQTWIESLGLVGTEELPGEADSGLRRMLHGLTSGVARVLEPPVGALTATTAGAPAFEVTEAELEEIVIAMLPFPLPSEPGARVRVRLLDGVGGLNVASRFSPDLVRAGAQIVVIGNAGEFGVEETSVLYHDPADADRARALADALGGARLSQDAVADAVLDVTVVIGSDRGLETG